MKGVLSVSIERRDEDACFVSMETRWGWQGFKCYGHPPRGFAQHKYHALEAIDVNDDRIWFGAPEGSFALKRMK